MILDQRLQFAVHPRGVGNDEAEVVLVVGEIDGDEEAVLQSEAVLKSSFLFVSIRSDGKEIKGILHRHQ